MPKPKTASKSPAFQFYPAKWLAGTDHLSAEAYRAYHKILCWMWLNSENYCTMPNNKTMWTIATGIKDLEVLYAVMAEIQNPDFLLLKVSGNNLLSNGLRKEVVKQKEFSDLQSKRASKRWECPGTAPAMPVQCSSSTSLSTSTDIRLTPPGVQVQESFQESFWEKAFEKHQGLKKYLSAMPGLKNCPEEFEAVISICKKAILKPFSDQYREFFFEGVNMALKQNYRALAILSALEDLAEVKPGKIVNKRDFISYLKFALHNPDIQDRGWEKFQASFSRNPAALGSILTGSET